MSATASPPRNYICLACQAAVPAYKSIHPPSSLGVKAIFKTIRSAFLTCYISYLHSPLATMASLKPSPLPAGFLDGPAPNLIISRIDFKKTPLPEYQDLYAVILDNALSPEECNMLVAAAESTTGGKWERAMVNVGGGRQRLDEGTRNCGRIIWDSPEIVAKIWARVEASVPELQRLEKWPKVTGNGPTRRNEVWNLTRCNERMRFLKYSKGEYFKRNAMPFRNHTFFLLTRASALRRKLRDTRPQGEVLLHSTPLSQRCNARSERRNTEGWCYDIPFIQHDEAP